MSDRAGAGRR